MKRNRPPRLLWVSLVAWSMAWAADPVAPDLLGSTRAQVLARLGKPMFAPRLGDEDKAEQFHAGSWDYLVGYRAERADAGGDDKLKVICVLKKRDFSAAQAMTPGELRFGLMEARNAPGWKPFDPLPNEVESKPGERDRDFETLHYRKSDGALTAKGQTTRRRQRLFAFTPDWHGIPSSAPSAWFLDLPADRLEELFRGTDGGAEGRLKLMPEPTEEQRRLLR